MSVPLNDAAGQRPAAPSAPSGSAAGSLGAACTTSLCRDAILSSAASSSMALGRASGSRQG
eukprot:CAMPEP_0177593640 /NCGR_PEP_ID=MMETSP0419_2-20121207/9276_1 /TAXON_ID=582737 /ORGANISM="Tetraselmis sp., Strain GSL018" /LENGTH=60 /DNA_ID=CAMNT_0019084737 /DNA_START=248 /DNA_END=427 /DNA_ORIENTATION=-